MNKTTKLVKSSLTASRARVSLGSSFRWSSVSPAPSIPGDPTTFIKKCQPGEADLNVAKVSTFIKNFLPAEAGQAVYDEVSTEVKLVEKIQVRKMKAARKSMKEENY